MEHTNTVFEAALASVRLESDGVRFGCAPGQTILSAALAAGIDLPYECASGSCGSCRARLVDGKVISLWPDATGLSERDRRKGDRILCCQSIVSGDCVIQIKPGGESLPTRPRKQLGRVHSIRMLNHDVAHLVLEMEHAVDFRPGQFMLFDLGGGVFRRAYSMANLPTDDGRLAFIIKRKPTGAASTYLFETVSAGQVLGVDGPYGRAWLRDDGEGDIVLLAGGSGLAPVWSIGQAALQRWPDRRTHLYFGVNSAKDLFWLDEIEEARRTFPNLNVNLVLMRASDADPASARIGMLGAVMAQDIGAVLTGDLYMAGPPGLIDSVLRDFVGTGRARAERVFFDRFG